MNNMALVRDEMPGVSGPRVAIALGAGGARGLAHVHALEALDDLGIRPVAIAGTSIGAIMGAAYSSGMSGREIREYVDTLFGDRVGLLAKLFKMRPGAVRRFMSSGGPRLGEINIERVLGLFLPPVIPHGFEALSIPLQVVATDYFANVDRTFASGPLRPALAASAAMPAVFRPVTIGGDIFIDGGTTNPVPFDLLQGRADIIVGIDVSGGPSGEKGKMPGKIDVMYAASQLMQQSIARAKAEHHQIDILLRPDVNSIRVLDFLRADSVLRQSAGLRDDLKRALDNVLEMKLRTA